MLCCCGHGRTQKPSSTHDCQRHISWLVIAQEVIHREIQTLHRELLDPRHGYRSVFGGLNRKGRNLSAGVSELEMLLEKSQAIPLTTSKPRQLMGAITHPASVYVEVLRDTLAR